MDLQRLNVSLTKHGAHKIASLLRDYPADDILDLVDGVHPTIDIDGGQAAKNLSVSNMGEVPELWSRVQVLGEEAIRALTLIGIVFSHHTLMEVMTASATGAMRGTVRKGGGIDHKAFTNFKHTLHELGFSTAMNAEAVSYDLRRLVAIDGLAPLTLDLLQRKMMTAGWDGRSASIDEMVHHGFHKVLAMQKGKFREWLENAGGGAKGGEKDEEFLAGADVIPTRAFAFRAGHRPRKTGTVGVKKSAADVQAELLHNEVQTAFYNKLVARHGEEAVATEQPTGLGTTIDLVVLDDGQHVFYEIKIAPTVRACIRQALPQLMEYAYWRCTDDLAHRLVIVGTHALTEESRNYLSFLRQRFGVPIWYKRFILRRLGR